MRETPFLPFGFCAEGSPCATHRKAAPDSVANPVHESRMHGSRTDHLWHSEPAIASEVQRISSVADHTLRATSQRNSGYPPGRLSRVRNGPKTAVIQDGFP